jgi:hypothetical protein
MNDFLSQIQCDELTSYEPTQADWEEYHAWLEEQEAAEPEPEDFDDIGDNELYEDRYNGEPFEDNYNDYDAWEAYCDYE